MSRTEAARYIGVSASKFDQLVADNRMPKPKRIDGRVVWDRFRLDASFTDLPGDEDEEDIVEYLMQGKHRQNPKQ